MVKKSTTDAIKTSTSNRATKKTAESIGDLIGNNIAYKITKNSLKNNSQTDFPTSEKSLEIPV